MVKFSTIRRFFRLGGIINAGKLDKGEVLLHVDAHKLSKRGEEHFEIFALGRFFVEVDDEQCFVGDNLFATIVFFALDASVAPCKFGSERFRNLWNVHAIQGVYVLLDAVLVFLRLSILQEHKAEAPFKVYAVDRYGRPHVGAEKDVFNVVGNAIGIEVAEEDGTNMGRSNYIRPVIGARI